jgi:hypothetical protein
MHGYYINSSRAYLRHSVTKFVLKFEESRSLVRNIEGGGRKRMVKTDETTCRVEEAIPGFHQSKFVSQRV